MAIAKIDKLLRLFTLYLTEKSEWFYNYKLVFYSILVGCFLGGLYFVVGEFLIFIIFWKFLLCLLLGHIVFSIYSVLGDYLFHIEVKNWCQGLWLLLSFRICLDIIIS